MRAFLGVKGLWLIGLIGPNKANQIVPNSLGAIWLIGLIGPNKANPTTLNRKKEYRLFVKTIFNST